MGDEDSGERGEAETVRATTADGPTERAGERPARVTIGARMLGRFRIDGELGSGGMGDVYRAFDTVLDRAVALKVLHTRRGDDESDQRRRVVREARAAAALEHPNAVTIFDVGEADGEVFIAMELLTGQVVSAELAAASSMETKLRWLLEAARALEAAHARGLVHRDVKPDNMFILKSGTLKLLDFGIAKREGDETSGEATALGPSSLRTTEGRVVGTPRYMAPEQRAGAATDPRTDQYAWGLVAFELLTGVHAREDDATADYDTAATRSRTAATGADRAVRLAAVPGLPRDVAEAIARALEVQKEDRFQSLAPIVALLELALSRDTSSHIASRETSSRARAETPVSASPSKPASGPPSGRRRILLGGSLVLLAAASAIVGVRSLRPWSHGSPMTASAANGPAPAVRSRGCTAKAPRTYPYPRRLPMTVTAGGLVTVRPAPKPEPSVIEREVGGHFEPWRPFDRTLMAEPSLMNATYKDGSVAIFVSHDRFFAIAANPDAKGGAMLRFGRAIDAAAATAWRGGLVFLVTGSEQKHGPWIGLVSVGPSRASVLTIVKNGSSPVAAPSLAATPEKLALSFSVEEKTYFAYADIAGNLIGDLIEAAQRPLAASLALPGTSAVLYWSERRDATTRLYSSTRTSDSTAFAAARIAVDEPVVLTPPQVVRLPARAADGTDAANVAEAGDSAAKFGLLWIAAAAGRQTLRMAPIADDGTVTTPVDVATASAFADLTAMMTTTGLQVAWVDEDKRMLNAVELVCPQ